MCVCMHNSQKYVEIHDNRHPPPLIWEELWCSDEANRRMLRSRSLQIKPHMQMRTIFKLKYHQQQSIWQNLSCKYDFGLQVLLTHQHKPRYPGVVWPALPWCRFSAPPYLVRYFYISRTARGLFPAHHCAHLFACALILLHIFRPAVGGIWATVASRERRSWPQWRVCRGAVCTDVHTHSRIWDPDLLG